MSKPQDRNVFQRPDGQWANQRQDASRPSDLHNTQAEAIDAAKDMLSNQGGGEVSIHGVDGKIRAKDTVKPGPDPRNIKG